MNRTLRKSSGAMVASVLAASAVTVGVVSTAAPASASTATVNSCVGTSHESDREGVIAYCISGAGYIRARVSCFGFTRGWYTYYGDWVWGNGSIPNNPVSGRYCDYPDYRTSSGFETK